MKVYLFPSRPVLALLVIMATSATVNAQNYPSYPPGQNGPYSYGNPAPQWGSPYIRPLPELVPQGPEVQPPNGVPVPPTEVPPPTADTFAFDQPCDEPPPKIWEGSFELGLNGSDGNSETFNIAIGATAKRKLPSSILTFEMEYTKNSSDGITTTNRSNSDGRYEWLFSESPWSLFVHGSLDVDEFTDWDSRVATDMGLGYQFFENDLHELKGRFGAGASREIGGSDDSWIPEATFGLDYEINMSERQKITVKADYFPAWENFSDYRLVTRANWKILLDEATNLSLKFGVIDRYDSTPGNAKANDIDYTAVLLWKF